MASYSSDGDRTARVRASLSEDSHKHESRDALNGIGSASSHHSTTSSVFSSTSHANKINGKLSSHAETPLTSYESSPPKVASPFPKPSQARLNDSPFLAPPPNMPPGSSHDASPISSPHRNRSQARPAQGEAKGYRAVWDPELDGKLGKEEKRKMKPKLKQFGTEVRVDNPIP